MQIIHTNDRAPWRSKYQALEAKYFSNDDFLFNGNAYAGWRSSPFHIINVGVDGDIVKSLSTMIVTTEAEMMRLVSGQAQEQEIKPYPPGDTQKGYLFWLSLIIEDKKQAPYLIHSAFKELVEVMRDWKVNISHVFAIAYTPISERLMRRYNFQKVGMYNGHYPIMCVNVLDNVWLKAFIPYIKVDSTPPWPGKVDRPVPEIDPKKRTDFDK
jgi:hypothetical protein